MSRGNKKSLMYTIKHRDQDGIGITNRISQAESQKIEYILPVVDYVLQKNEFSATELKQNIKELNPKSIDNTIILLRKKNLIKKIRTEQNNKKIFQKKSRKTLKTYFDDLQKYRKFKIYSKVLVNTNKVKVINDLFQFFYKFNTEFQKGIKKSSFMAPLPKNFFVQPLKIKNKKTFDKLSATEKIFPTSLTINEMSYKIVPKIIWDFHHGRICETCFQEGKLRYYEYIDDEYLCDAGHLSKIDLSETEFYSENKIFDIKKNSKQFTEKQFEYQKNLLKNKKQRNSNSQIQYLEWIFGKI